MSRNSRPVERVAGSLSSLKSMARNAGPNPGKSLLCSFSFNLAFQIEFCSLFSLLFVCPLWFIFPFFSRLYFSCFTSRGIASLFWLVSTFSRLCLSSFRFRFRSRSFAICLSHLMFRFTLLIFCFVWKLTLSLFIGKGKGSSSSNTTTGARGDTTMEVTMAAEA